MAFLGGREGEDLRKLWDTRKIVEESWEETTAIRPVRHSVVVRVGCNRIVEVWEKPRIKWEKVKGGRRGERERERERERVREGEREREREIEIEREAKEKRRVNTTQI
jgi:hypothetical protein